MKQCSQDFIQELQSLGRQVDCKVEYTLNSETITLHDELYSISPSFKGNILKSVMKEMVIESSVEIPNETIINVKIGLLINNEEYEYLDYGNYVVFENEKQVDENTYRIKCYDKMVYAMKDYESLGVTYPISIKNYLSALCTKIGLTLKDTNFTNQNRNIPSELFAEQGLTYRDVLDQIAQATASTICIDENDQVEVRYINDTETIVTEHMLKDVNVNVGEKYGPINSIVLSRANADNVYLRDEQSVAQNGLHEIKIVDNQIMNFNDRDGFLPGLLQRLDGLEYYTNDYTSTGLLIYDVCDMYEISITGDPVWKQCIMFNDEISIDNGIEEQVYTELPEEAETDYTKADKTDQRINKTYFIVDKQNQTIESVVENVGEQNQKITEIEQTVDEINSKISDVVDITETQESMNGSLQFDDVNESEPVTINIRSTGEYITLLHPWATGKYPSNNLIIKMRTLRFINTKTYVQTTDSKYKDNKNYYNKVNSQYVLLIKGTDYNVGDIITGTIYQNEYFDWELPDDLLYYNENVYDELLIDYETQTSQILKRCRRTGINSVEPLGTTQIINIPYPSIELTDGDYTVQMLKYNNEPYPCYIKVRVMKQNIYTTQFYTKAEVNSLINQTELAINLNVDMKLTNYVTETEMNATIAITAGQITSEVRRVDGKVDDKVGKTEVISRINQTAEQIQIEANKIDFNGAISANGNFKINMNGTMECKGASITDGTIQWTRGNLFSYYAPDELFLVDLSNQAYQCWIGIDNGVHVSSRNNYNTNSFSVRQNLQYVIQAGQYRIAMNASTFRFKSDDGIGEVYASGNNSSLNGGVINVSYYTAYYNGYEIAVNTSDKRLKKNIKNTKQKALDVISQIKHKEFDWKENDKHQNIGYIAQELEEIDSNFVIKNDYIDKDGKKTGDYRIQVNVLPVLATATKAIQELQEEIEELRKKVQ